MVAKILEIIYQIFSVKAGRRINKDRALFELFLEEMPARGESVDFLKNHDMGNTFSPSNLGSLNNLVETWEDPDRKFITKKIEKKKYSLIKLCREFLSELNRHVAPNRKGRLSIGAHEFEDRSELLHLKERLNTMATDVYNEYEEFIKVAHEAL